MNLTLDLREDPEVRVGIEDGEEGNHRNEGDETDSYFHVLEESGNINTRADNH